MSVDKLVDSTQLDTDLTSVANAIRTKGGTSASLAFPADFVTAIAAISGGGGGSDILIGDPYLITIGASNFFDNTVYCDVSANSGNNVTRLSVWKKSGDIPVKWFMSPSIKPDAPFSPIVAPSGSGTVYITTNGDVQLIVACYEVTNNVATSKLSSSGWINISAGTEQSFAIASGTGCIGISFRKDSNNSTFSQKNDYDGYPRYVKIRFA